MPVSPDDQHFTINKEDPGWFGVFRNTKYSGILDELEDEEMELGFLYTNYDLFCLPDDIGERVSKAFRDSGFKHEWFEWPMSRIKKKVKKFIISALNYRSPRL